MDEEEGEGYHRGEYAGEVEEGERREEGEETEGKTDEEEEPPPPPPPEQEKELLFLIEFMVDTLTINTANMNVENIDPCALQGPARVALTFLHFPPMLLSEKDLNPDRMGEEVVKFNAGKSLMFALTENQFEEPPDVFLVVEASKEMPHAFRIPYVTIGKTKVQLSELFKQLFEKYDENPGKTVSKSIKDKYDLQGEKGKPSGDITIYIRLTCIGENIITEFSTTEDLIDTVLFKNKESKKVYECRETYKSEDETGKTLPGWGDERRPRECEPPPPPPPPPDPEDENFEEIFAEINGSAILVKVEKSGRRPKPKEFHVSDFCDCNIPLPPELVAGLSDDSLRAMSGGASTNIGSGGPVQVDKRVGIDSANQLKFQVPPVETLSQPGTQNSITYNVKTCTEGDKHDHQGKSRFQVFTDGSPEGPPPKMPNDSEKDVFVLKVIKRGKQDKGKDVLELEFKIPKEKIEPPPKVPYMIERAAGPEKEKKPKKKK